MDSVFLLSLGMVIFGAALLVKGAGWLVDGGAGIALKSGISSLVVGLTVVAFGTSAPELSSSIVAAVKGAGDISFGNVIGSNVANIALILGATALVRPITVNRDLLRWELPFLIIISALVWGIGLTHSANRIFGIILLALFAYYIFHCLRASYTPVEVHDTPTEKPFWLLVLLVVLGIAALAWGGQLFVDGARDIALKLGVSEAVVGLTIVALGTSLPELATSLIAAMKGHADISVGNIVGSNVFNILMVVGTTATIIPYEISPDRFLMYIGLPTMMALSILLFPFSKRSGSLSRIEGTFFLVVYAAYSITAAIM